ncbi:VWA domain-containing protein [Frankia sp. AgW1.1]|uniref:VWA domain-containing protein n=1 Tax=Frankia sp. AgW1.1 TaxID=1836971 RepID=UPI0019341384|nr:VWA domain-containing protein [Frankia sp. AgW1.1]MBL7487045.1 VWA domain-containing protein [Frankia sp. AgW1.1]
MFGRSATTSTQTVARSVRLVQDPSGRPAVDLSKVREGHVDLAKRADKAGVALSKHGLSGIRAQAVLVLDHSGSMKPDYRSGAVQGLVERALGFALQIDVDGEVPVIPFDSRVGKTTTVTAANYQGIVGSGYDGIWRNDAMGSTRLDLALGAVRKMAEKTDAPIFAMVVTDGDPDYGYEQAATDMVIDLARYPVFVKFCALGNVPYLNELDRLDPSRRLVDNVNTKPFPSLSTMTDMQFAEAMADEWESWVFAARQVGVLL